MKALIELLAVFIQTLISWICAAFWLFSFKILNVIVAGIFGWFVGLFFGETFLAIFAQLGISGFSMWQIGACLGFIASFFVSFVTPPKKQIHGKNQPPTTSSPFKKTWP